MVVIVDLDDDASSTLPSHASSFPNVKPLHHSLTGAVGANDRKPGDEASRPNPNINGFSAALSCYPIVRQLASQLDLNSLHDLSRTCRQFRANLLEYRDQLVKQSLRCSREDEDLGSKLAMKLRESHSHFSSARQLTSGKIGKCARDMVDECQRCGTVVCRNCTIKPPPTPVLRARHRRLCRTCSKVPIQLLTALSRPQSESSGTTSPPCSPSPRPCLFDDHGSRAFTAPAFERSPCCCDGMVWICQPCGQRLKNADMMYLSGWNWRTQYTHYLGGVGEGAGEGNEGVNCGRGSHCLAAKVVEHEVEASEVPVSSDSRGADRWKGTSYHAQEIEGVGGVFKLKAKKQVRVGECVKFYEKERTSKIQYLEKEVNGKLRSWCAWCERVILGERDRAEAAGQRPASSSASSASSG
ncbi:hypothetical protein BDV96DRAFT_346951 [Lophiotrema nucula]|uniref:F-box domain-containing protein n=1 Tax=Lophiotrema nucula TaxID=690887 RepID=A0A6A5ZKF1_9PLEO|nr:hypothetical protein BDV96DRAFT_346951 [Lophiotrema nucula]